MILADKTLKSLHENWHFTKFLIKLYDSHTGHWTPDPQIVNVYRFFLFMHTIYWYLLKIRFICCEYWTAENIYAFVFHRIIFFFQKFIPEQFFWFFFYMHTSHKKRKLRTSWKKKLCFNNPSSSFYDKLPKNKGLLVWLCVVKLIIFIFFFNLNLWNCCTTSCSVNGFCPIW